MLGFPSRCKFQASAEGRINRFLLNLSPSFLSLHLSIFTLLPYSCMKNLTVDPEFLRPSSREITDDDDSSFIHLYFLLALPQKLDNSFDIPLKACF